jgi:alkanesulfonate monooxygenase SsuD/methylene tetrahydromethanopterin reductase-like flavin-dependent oxidoreductase (luciferase family)
VLAAIASRTQSILLGTGVVLGPLRQPIRLAEEAAVVDQLSAGRLLLGLGLGYVDDELRAFDSGGAPRGARLEAIIEILRFAWTGETFSYEADHIRLDRVRVTPRPYQAREIPILLGGYASAALDRAARLADGHIVGRGTPEIIKAAVRDLEAGGRPTRSPFQFVVNVVAVLDEPGGHAHEAVAAFEVQQRVYERLQRGRDVYRGQIPDGADASELTLGTIDAYVQVRGSAEDIVTHCRAVLSTLPTWGTPHLALRIVFPEPDLERQLERVHLFGERVLAPLRSP